MTNNLRDKHSLLIDAAKHLRAAIALLDEADAPAHIAAHLDLAANQIDDVIGSVDRATCPDWQMGSSTIRVS